VRREKEERELFIQNLTTDEEDDYYDMEEIMDSCILACMSVRVQDNSTEAESDEEKEEFAETTEICIDSPRFFDSSI
jgi:hypothetical protein